MHRLTDLPAFDPESGHLNAIIETPKGSRNKFDYDEEHRLFDLHSVLPAGAVFPFDFGFIPSTLAEDGDPLDVLVLMDEPAYPGCRVPSRLIGVIEAEQTEGGKTERNDRLIAVFAKSHAYQEVRSLKEVRDGLLDEIEHFFISYNALKGKEFQPLGRRGPRTAEKLVHAGQECRGAQARANGRAGQRGLSKEKSGKAKRA
jgi:inorganic pyrophosphatase